MNHYPIRTISELTGVPTTTLRAWERRYGLLKPSRTAKGHRLYSSDDIELIKNIVSLLKKNHTISEAIRIINNPELSVPADESGDGHWDMFQQRMLKSIESFNEQNLDKTYNEALSIYPIDMVTEHVIIPVLSTLGEQWQSREAGIAEEHFFSAFLRNKLGARLHHESQRSRGSKILVCCLPGEYHELGILLFCIAAIGHGYQILYLGTNMPPAQLPVVAKRTDVAGILLSGTRVDQWDSELEQELKNNIKAVKIPYMIGGELSAAYGEQIEKLGAHVLGPDHVAALEKMETIIPAFVKK
jgi:MerR family transcriptional regulator, light-induced transcriptional regulator